MNIELMKFLAKILQILSESVEWQKIKQSKLLLFGFLMPKSLFGYCYHSLIVIRFSLA
jgi:hypothetical protein